MRALADGSEMPAREAPTVMLPSSTTAANRRKSVRSKCTAQVLNELPFCLWCRRRQRYENPSLRLFEPTDNSVRMSNPIAWADHGERKCAVELRNVEESFMVGATRV